MDWEKFAQMWGPAVPMFAIFVYYLHRLIMRTVPRGFHALRTSIDHADRKADERHREAIGEITNVKIALTAILTRAAAAEKQPATSRRPKRKPASARAAKQEPSEA